MDTISENIKTRRKALGITQKELADKLSISDKTVSRWESGNQIPDALLIPDLALALDTTVTALYGIEAEPREVENKQAEKEEFKPRYGIMTWYKILMTAGIGAAVVSAFELAKADIIYAASNNDHSLRVLLFAVLFASCAFIAAAEAIYRRITKKKDLNKGIYLRTDTLFFGLAAIIISIIFLLVLPAHLGVAYEVWYGASAIGFAALVEFLFIVQKRRLRQAGAAVGKHISLISAIIICAAALALAAVFIIMALYTSGQAEHYTVAEGLESIIAADSGYYDLLTFEHKVNFYVYLALTFPVITALIVNHAENLIKSRPLIARC